MRTKIYIILFILINNFLSAQNNAFNYKLSNEESNFLDTLQHKTFLYFINEVNLENGLVKDRSTKESPASIAATGFAIPVWAVGSEHNWISRNDAATLTYNLLKFLLNSEQSIKPDATGYQGLYYHFLDMKYGKRMWNSELSTIDTGLLLAGIHFAIHYYKRDNKIERGIRKMAEQLTKRVNWNFMTMPDSGKYANTISLSWEPERGLSNIGWVGYNEALIMYIIAAGTNFKDPIKAYNRWLEFYEWREPYGYGHVLFPPLFGHQFSHIFIDLRGIKDDYLRKKNIDYFENSRRAVLVQKLYAVENPLKWKGYDSLIWGLSASDGPGDKFNFDNRKFDYYNARGTSGPEVIQNDDGTISPMASISSIVFAPEVVIPTLMEMYRRYGEKGLWGRYGFTDAFNPTVNWFGTDYLGIDQGPIVLMIENFRNEFIWKYLMKDEIIKRGMNKLKLRKD